MTNEAIFNKIQEIIAEQLDLETVKIELTTSLTDGLGADSLDIFEIINEVEDEFDVKIETENGLNTVGDLVQFVADQVGE